jgi:preprotein translocase subunit YajC
MTIASLNFLLADAPSAPAKTMPNPVGSQITMFGYLIVVMVVMWLLMVAPQRKKQKELEATLTKLKAGDKVVTNSGIIGVVLSVKDKSISIRSAETKLEVLKTSVAEVSSGSEVTETKS